jgi:hypothetical protein
MKGTTLEKLMEEWTADSGLNLSQLEVESAKISKLHSKYLNYMTYHNMVSKAVQAEYIELRRLKSEYYQGQRNTDTEFLKKYNLEPIRGMILKQDIPLYLDSDRELIQLGLKKAAHDEIVEYCKYVIKEVANRQWNIRNAIEFMKFTGGDVPDAK